MSDHPEPRAATVLLIHGTGATAPEDEGQQWWQRGSSFSLHLERTLGGLARCLETGTLFRWSGANSEQARRRAAQDLLDNWLLRFEREGRTYHLIGHSHGGSLIWEALVEASRRNQALDHLASWSTVGTPFLHYGARWSDWLLLLPAVGVAMLWASIPGRAAITWAHARELYDDGAATTVAALGLLFGSAVLFVGHLVWRLVVAFASAQDLPRRRRYERRANVLYGARWLGVWTNDDEAINGLKNTVSFDVRVAPRASLWSEFSIRSASDVLKAPVVLFGAPLYNFFVARPTDAFISDRVARRLQGNDRRGVILEAVGSAPLRGQHVEPLPQDIAQQLTEQADAHAATTLRKVRQTLGMAAVDESATVVGRLSEHLSYQELVHTSYFDHHDIRRRLAAHISAHPLRSGEAGSLQDRPSEDDGSSEGTGQELFAEFRDAWGTRAMRQAPAFIVSTLVAGVLLVPVFLIAVTTSALFARVESYTDEANLAALIERAPLAEMADDVAADDKAKDNAIREWVLALVDGGHAPDALSSARRVTESSLQEKALLWIAAGLAGQKKVGEAEQASRSSGASAYQRQQVVSELIEREQLNTALFMARSIPEERERRGSIEQVAMAHGKKADAARAFELLAEAKSDEVTESNAYAALTVVLIESKQLDQALVAARRVINDHIRREPLVKVAKALRSAGRLADATPVAIEAIETAKRTDHDPEELNPGSDLFDVAKQLAEAGFAREAMTAADEISSPHRPDRAGFAAGQQQSAFMEISRAAADQGLLAEARDAARRMTEENNAGFRLMYVVEKLIAAERFVEAYETAGSLASEYYKNNAFEKIAEAHAQRGDAAALLQAVKHMSKAKGSQALARLSEKAVQDGRRHLAAVTLQNAIALARDIDDTTKLYVLPVTARVSLAMDQSSAANAIATELVTVAKRHVRGKGPSEASEVQRAAQSLAEAGFIGQATAIVDTMPHGYFRNLALRDVANVLKNKGRVTESDALRARIRDNPNDSTDNLPPELDSFPPFVPPTRPGEAPRESPQKTLAALQKMPKSADRHGDASAVAVAFAGERNEQGIRDALLLIDDAYTHDKALAGVIGQLLQDEQAMIAAALANSMKSESMRAGARLEILQAAPQVADREFLRRLRADAELLKQVFQRSSALSAIAIEFVRLGELRTARLIADACLATDRLSAYSVILYAHNRKTRER